MNLTSISTSSRRCTGPATSGPIVANVPQPQRYALAKLLVHEERRSSNPPKAAKDLEQAATLIDYLSRNDRLALQEAWTDLVSRGPGWRTRAHEGLLSLAARHSGIECAIQAAKRRK